MLSVNAGRLLTFDVFLYGVWGIGHTGGRGASAHTVKRLRRDLCDDANNPKCIFAEPRVGYRMRKMRKPGALGVKEERPAGRGRESSGIHRTLRWACYGNGGAG